MAEAAVVGRPTTHRRGHLRLRGAGSARPSGDEAKAIAKQLRDHVAKEIGPIAKPKDIRFGDNLPKTRSGKIMRRLLSGQRGKRGDGQDDQGLHEETPFIRGGTTVHATIPDAMVSAWLCAGRCGLLGIAPGRLGEVQ